MESLIFLGLAILIVVILVMAGVKVVPQSETRVIERLGRFHSVLPPGLNIIWPFIDKPKTIYTRRVETGLGGRTIVRMTATSSIDLREQVYDFPSQQVITKDNVTTEINALLYFQVVDPKKSVYEIDNLPNAIEKLTQTSLRNVIGELELDETLTSRDTINSRLQAILDEATNKWGVKVNRVELQDITPREACGRRWRSRCRLNATDVRKFLKPRARRSRSSSVPKVSASRASTRRKRQSSRKSLKLRANRAPRYCRLKARRRLYAA